MAVGGVGLALLLFFLDQAGVELPILVIVFGSIAALVMIGYGMYGYFHFPTKNLAESLGADPAHEFLSAQLGAAKAFIGEEKRLGTGVVANDPPSHPKQFTLIHSTQRELAKLNQALAGRLEDTDWESVPFRRWMHRLEALSKGDKPIDMPVVATANSPTRQPARPAPPAPAAKSQRPDNSLLVEQLTDRLAEGLDLLENWLDLRSGVMPRGPITTVDDVDAWESSVKELLRNARPLHFIMFTKELPPQSIPDLSFWPNPDRRRLFERVRDLEIIIIEIRGY